MANPNILRQADKVVDQHIETLKVDTTLRLGRAAIVIAQNAESPLLHLYIAAAFTIAADLYSLQTWDQTSSLK